MECHNIVHLTDYNKQQNPTAKRCRLSWETATVQSSVLPRKGFGWSAWACCSEPQVSPALLSALKPAWSCLLVWNEAHERVCTEHHDQTSCFGHWKKHFSKYWYKKLKFKEVSLSTKNIINKLWFIKTWFGQTFIHEAFRDLGRILPDECNQTSGYHAFLKHVIVVGSVLLL